MKNTIKYENRIQLRKEKEKEQRREEIIKSAEKLFISQGFDATTMDDIALEAALSKGTLYNYCKSKDVLYLMVATQSIKVLNNMIEKELSASETGIEKIFSIGYTYFEFSQKFPNNLKIINDIDSRSSYLNTMENIESGKNLNRNEIELKTEIERYRNYFLGTIKDAISNEEIVTDLAPEMMALILASITNGLIKELSPQNELLKSYGSNIKEVLELTFEWLYKGLKFRKHKDN